MLILSSNNYHEKVINSSSIFGFKNQEYYFSSEMTDRRADCVDDDRVESGIKRGEIS